MIRQKISILATIAVAATFSLFGAGQSEAATLTCDAPVSTTDFTRNAGGGYNGCEYFDPHVSGTLDVDDMNDNSVFNHTSWINIGKMESGATEGDTSVLTTSYSQAGGSYSIAASWFNDWNIIAIGFKDGNSAGVLPSNAVVYSFTAATFGDYLSMFYVCDDDGGSVDCTTTTSNWTRKGGDGVNGGAISNITIWGARSFDGCNPLTELCGPPVNEVPLPAALPLLLAALGTIGVVGRRRKRIAA